MIHERASSSAGQHGNVLVAVLIGVMLLAGLATPLLMRSLRDQQATSNGVLAGRLLAVAESGLHYNYSRMRKDRVYCAKDTAGFAWDESTQEFVSPDLLLSVGGDAQQNTFSLRIQYLGETGAPVVFADRADPKEEFRTVKVRSRAGTASVVREIAAFYEYKLSDSFDGAIVSDMVPPSLKVVGGKSGAQYGNLVLDGAGKNKRHVVFGNLRANGTVVYDGANTAELADTNADTYLLAHRGDVRSRLGGTDSEIPDFTEIGNADQLFDFNRFLAAAQAGAGAVYDNLSAFEAAVNAANAANVKLEGIQAVLVDPSVEGGSPKLDMAAGIHVRGTLMFLFAPGTPGSYKIIITAPVFVNAADLSTVDFANESTWTTGYPPVYVDPGKRPQSVDISGKGFKNFTDDDDLPAVLFSSGVVDWHGPVNVCGVVYGPSFIEVENKSKANLYINGAVIGGGGIYFEADSSLGMIAIRHDKNTTNKLAVSGEKGMELARVGYMIVR